MPTFEGETIRLLSHGGKSLVGIEPIASDREAAPLTARPSLLSPKARAKLGFYSFQVSPTNQNTVQFREMALIG